MGGSSFTIQWPVEGEQARVLTAYNAATGVVVLAASAGATVKAGATGRVVTALSDGVEIQSAAFTVLYSNLRNLKVQVGQEVTAGQVIGESAGPDGIKLMVRQTIDPTPMLVEPQKPKPIYVRATQIGVRVREKPVDGKPIGQLNPGLILESLEAADVTQRKIGVMGEWLNLRTPSGLVGYSACQFLELYTGPEPGKIDIPGLLNITGVNLDMNNALGRPSPDRMKGIGWIRVKFNVSMNPDKPEGDPSRYGNTDINATFNRTKPFLEMYTRAGIKVLMVFTHQLYGEGAGYNWQQMDMGRWRDLIGKYADFARRTAEKFVNTNLVHAYQIWNEQDTNPSVARAAVPIPATAYGAMLTETIRAIRSVDKTTPIITGGHVGGPDAGSAYARQTLANMPADIRPDGIATHPYGRGVRGHKFSPFGSLEDEIAKYAAVIPGRPIWITEWGVLDQQDNMSVCPDVCDYAIGFMNIVKQKFPGQVAAAMWYAWADGMDNGYGLVDRKDRGKAPLYDQFLKL